MFRKRPHDIRQWFKQVIFVRETGFPLLASFGQQYFTKADYWNIYGKKFDDTSIFMAV